MGSRCSTVPSLFDRCINIGSCDTLQSAPTAIEAHIAWNARSKGSPWLKLELLPTAALPTALQRDGCPKIINLGSAKTDLFYERKKYGFRKR